MRRIISRVALATCLAAGVLTGTAGSAQAAPNKYVTMSDGTSIALNVQFPSGDAPEGGWPTIIQIDGYAGGSSAMNANSPTFGGGNYATVHMSLRGTACSGGRFDLFDRRSSQDGYEVIEWIAAQDWSDGDVAIWGHSYSGLTGWLVASTQPPSLKAMSVSGLIDDLYRGIVYMGGVSNLGFPLIWTGAYRPAADYQGMGDGLSAGDAQCAANQAGRVPPDVQDNAILNGLMALGEDGQWWASHSNITYLDAINIPTHIVQSYQDEQTGPRGSNLLWQRLDERKPDLPKRLLLTNGVHSTNTGPPEVRDDRIAFLDCYVRDACSGDITDPSKRVKVLWEMHGSPLRSTGVTADPDWPLAQTDWTRYFLGADGALGTSQSAGAPDTYVAGSKRAGAFLFYAGAAGHELASANLPDEVRYETEPFETAQGLAGPINATLFASTSAPDTEFYVELSDVDPDGNATVLQRGMLKGSHRELDPYQTDFNAAGDIIRPYHPHTNTLTKLLVPGEVNRFEVEVFPVGHVFRPGHSLRMRITNPPQVDNIAVYIQTTPAGVNQIFHDADHPSSILLPLVDVGSLDLGPALGCGAQVGLNRCGQPAL